MNRVLNRIVLVTSFALLAACGQKDGPATAPSGITVTPGDGQVTVSWKQDPGLDYWIFSAAGSTVTVNSATKTLWPATSPQIVNGLTNGTVYSFVMNATSSGGPAGPASPSVSATPRLAGGTWTRGTPLGTGNLNALVVGASKYVVVGSGGAIYTSTDAKTWTAAVSNVTTDLNALVFNSIGTLFIAGGVNGVILTSPDAVTWTTHSTGSAARINGVTVANSLSLYVAVGAGGAILTSADGTTWTARASGTTQDLYDVRFLNSNLVAVGAGGTVLTSADGVTWTARNAPTKADLHQSTYGLVNSAGVFVIVGNGGTVLTSTDLATWTAQTSNTTQNLYTVCFGSQFAVGGANGTVLTSTTTTSWATASVADTHDLYGILFNAATYVAVGATGTNQISQ